MKMRKARIMQYWGIASIWYDAAGNIRRNVYTFRGDTRKGFRYYNYV